MSQRKRIFDTAPPKKLTPVTGLSRCNTTKISSLPTFVQRSEKSRNLTSLNPSLQSTSSFRGQLYSTNDSDAATDVLSREDNNFRADNCFDVQNTEERVIQHSPRVSEKVFNRAKFNDKQCCPLCSTILSKEQFEVLLERMENDAQNAISQNFSSSAVFAERIKAYSFVARSSSERPLGTMILTITKVLTIGACFRNSRRYL